MPNTWELDMPTGDPRDWNPIDLNRGLGEPQQKNLFCCQPLPHFDFTPKMIAFCKMDDRATAPTRNLETDAGMDLYALEHTVVPSLFAKHREWATQNPWSEFPAATATKIRTGIALEIPFGMYGKIEDRSSIGSKLLITVGGVIDSEYRGDVTVCLANLSFHEYVIKPGDKIAQIVFHKYEALQPYEVSALTPSNRGEKGFGSSGA